MLGPELLNLTVRPTPIFLEGTASLRIDQPGPRELGLTNFQVVKGVVSIERGQLYISNWISHNYTHLMEQPTVFYPVVIMLALMGDNSALSINLAWGYAGIRVLHSLWQANVNTIPVRFALFALSSLCLITLAARAVMQAV